LSALAVLLRRPASPSRRKAGVAFRVAPAHRIHVAFRDIARAKACETPYTQHRLFGAVIAFAYRNV